jgi:hypothetical protein
MRFMELLVVGMILFELLIMRPKIEVGWRNAGLRSGGEGGLEGRACKRLLGSAVILAI